MFCLQESSCTSEPPPHLLSLKSCSVPSTVQQYVILRYLITGGSQCTNIVLASYSFQNSSLEKIFNIINHQENVNENHNEVLFPHTLGWPLSKKPENNKC